MTNRSVRTRIFPYVFTVAAGFGPDNPLGFNLSVPDSMLRCIDLVIPSGHNFLTGIAFLIQGQRMVPPLGADYNLPDTADWITDDNAKLRFDAGYEVDGFLQAIAYNNDIFDHTFYIRFTVDDLVLVGERGGASAVNVVAV